MDFEVAHKSYWMLKMEIQIYHFVVHLRVFIGLRLNDKFKGFFEIKAHFMALSTSSSEPC
jgi:hypothetical protein